MPKGPNGQKRPADVIGCANLVGRIATGEVEDDKSRLRKNRANGGLARSECLSPKRRSEIARSAANARWAVEKQNECN